MFEIVQYFYPASHRLRDVSFFTTIINSFLNFEICNKNKDFFWQSKNMAERIYKQIPKVAKSLYGMVVSSYAIIGKVAGILRIHLLIFMVPLNEHACLQSHLPHSPTT